MVASSSPSAPRVVIVGITGQQGGSVALSLLASSKPYRLVGLTRDATKPSATKWVEKGVEIVQVDLRVGNESEVRKVLKKGDILFGVTNFTEHADAARETAEGKLLVDAALSAEVSLFIWSSLWNVTKISSGKYPNVVFFDSKAVVTEYAEQSGIPFATVPCGFYSSNLWESIYVPNKQDDGSHVLYLPFPSTTVVPVLNPAVDYGDYVRAAIEVEGLGAGSTVLSGRNTSVDEMVKVLSEATGKKVTFKEVSKEEWLALPNIKAGGPFGPILYEMFRYQHEWGYYGLDDIEASHTKAGITPRTFAEITKDHKGSLLRE